ncbi:hypothetical protein [Streptomyces sp. NBC_01803]|uniref:hypothetical protein n=1 Tax=Streptomyces sp. NBC_01803 TaxID=2975946 RepID=UPI002DDA8F15|nr:hypothetical protein [Streptomyces sp. NBC_01803]WSA46483.1 hypothetical protein OIE51_21240 [Streptomyces sp. NBC_01803]
MTTDDQTVQDAVRRVLGEGAHAHITRFPGGNLSITVTSRGHTATIDGHPGTGWGWSVDPGEDEGFSGHEQMAETLDGALLSVRGTIGA